MINPIQHGLIRLSLWTLEACGARVDLCSTGDTVPAPVEYVMLAQWGSALCEFLLLGESLGWSQRGMEGAGICRRPVWQLCTDTLSMMGVIVKIPDYPSGWGMRRNGAAWHRHAFRHALLAGEWELADYLPRAERPPFPLLPAPMFGIPIKQTRISRPDRVAGELARPATLDAAETPVF